MFKSAWSFLKDTLSEWGEDKVTRHAAAIAYFAIFSIAPLFVITVAIAGFVYGEQAVQGLIVDQTKDFVGERGAQVIENVVAGASKTSEGVRATILGALASLFGGSIFFLHLQGSLNAIWGVRRKPGRGIMGTIKDRLFAMLMVLSAGALVLVLMFASSFLWTITSYFQDVLPIPALAWQIFNFLVTFSLLTFIFALVLKVVPDVKIRWRDVWVGALVTAFLFTIGQFLLGMYIGRSSFGSTYGAAGSLVALLLWVYYSAQIFLLGAEMTQVYARRYGRQIEPADNAVYVRKHPAPQ